jgi:enamine deaminase RidA (YjgF/YER057c/UK114 family)
MADRLSIEVEELPMHSQPFPVATRKGNTIFSSAISGFSAESKSVPDDAAEQIRNAFANVKTIVEAAGGTVEDICKVQCFLADREMRPLVNEEWVKLFPDETSRPVRHTVGGPLPNNYVIQLEFVAVTD